MKLDVTTIVDQFNHQTAAVRYGVFGAILLMIVLVDFFTIMGIQRALLKHTTERITSLSTDIQRVTADKQRIPQMRLSLEDLKKQSEQLHSRVRPLSDMPMILENIYRVAGETGIKIEQLTPMRDKQEKLTESPDGGHFYNLPVYLEGTGSYHTFGRFLNKLDGSNFLFSIMNLVLEPSTVPGSGVSIKATLKVILVEHNETESK